MKGFVITFSLLLVSVLSTVSCDESNSKRRSALIPCTENEKSDDNLSYEWFFGSTKSPVKHQSHIKDRAHVTADGALLINRFTKADYGKYICRVKSGNSVVKDRAVNVDERYRLKSEVCHPSACIEARKCGSSTKSNLSCLDDGEVCCSVVREEDKHRCRHFYGECMKGCNPRLRKDKADDCEEGTSCCVLV